ncbi:MAG: hypothetical protein JJU12_04080 [Chlamydiales bacterium]|nr:hypothetical protein [Chlamydiales bacterium]
MMPSKIEIFYSVIFFCAVVHTFLTSYFYSLHTKFQIKSKRDLKKENFYRLLSEVFYFLSEIELVFGFWIIPLIIGLLFASRLEGTLRYLESRDYTYALYMAVVVAFASTKPIILFAENMLERISRLGGNNAKSWWWTILTVGPFLDIFLKEPGAMTIASILLAKTCFNYIESRRFSYGTLALLFINISLGGLFAPHTSRSLFLVAQEENWDLAYTLLRFGWKALLIILVNNSFYYLLFRKDFAKDSSGISAFLEKEKRISPPVWLTCIHLLFFLAIIVSSEYPPVFLGVFFLFLGVHRVTFHYQGEGQGPLHIMPAILVGFFFASLLIHGELQSWWVTYLLERLDFMKGLAISGILSAFIDNAVVLYFLDQVQPLPEAALYAIVAGALSSGSLTLMANGPNLIGYTNLKLFFGGTISLVYLFLAALPLTVVSILIFWIFA